GIDPDRIRNLAVARGVLAHDDAIALDDRSAVDLIFVAGFSTAARVSDLSGRGVGMDVVRAAAAGLGGKVTVSSEAGRGTTMRFALPVTMVLTRLMVVACGEERYGLPLDCVAGATRVTPDRIAAVRAGRAFLYRDRAVPLVGLGALVGARQRHDAADRVIVVRTGGEMVGIAVDAILDRMDAAVRPLGGLLAGAPGFAGTTLLPDGGVLLVLDLPELLA
ncbi:MAG TPA: chemotaxis protein CheW, partial [Roseomonas sp.]